MMSNLIAEIPAILAWQGGGDDAAAAAGGAITLVLVLAFYGLLLAAAIGGMALVYYVLYSSVDRIPPQFRQIEPAQVFLLLIPFFNFYWIFVVYTKIPQSFRAYFHSIGRYDVGDCGEQLGLWTAVLVIVSIIPCVNFITGPIASILAIIMLVKFWSLRNQIPAPAGA